MIVIVLPVVLEAKVKNYSIAVLEGDGIGPEIIREGLKVLKAVEEVSGVTFSTTYYPYGAEHYLATGEVLPDSALRELEQNNAIFFGAAGDPRVPPGILEIELILKIRFLLDQYINLRPIHLFPNVVSPLRNDKGIDFYIIRENTEDFYNGMGHRFDVRNDNSLRQQCALEMKRKRYRAQVSIDSQLDIKEDYAITLGLMTKGGAERVFRYSFDLARRKGKAKVTSVDKANVIPHLYTLWREAFSEVSKEYPDISTEFTFVDAVTMWFVKNPENFGVVVAPNLFGDIISDLGAGISGGLGFAAGANINPGGVSMFEPIHGSAPKYKGLNIANPIATILSGGIMLEELGQERLGRLVREAVTAVLRDNVVRTKDMGGRATTSEMGDAIAAKVYEISRGIE
jgi:3-isopropylmalate dehydrogenase